MSEDDGVLFKFHPVDADDLSTFDQAKIRVPQKPNKRWTGSSLIIQARVDRVGIVVFTFGVNKGSDRGELVWGTTTAVWPPRDGMDRMRVIDDVKRVVREFLTRFPEVGLAPSVSDSVKDLGTFYEMTGTIQMVPHRKPQPQSKHGTANRNAPQGIKASALGLSKLRE